jgi:hypothetical protein
MTIAPSTTVRPEPVEGPFCFFTLIRSKKQGFDKLSPNGVVAVLMNSGSL